MLLKNTVRGGLVLAVLAGGCADHHQSSDARVMLDAGAFDAGTLLDATRDSRTPDRRDASDLDTSMPGRDTGTGDARLDSSTPDSGDATMLEAAIRAVCTKVNMCAPSVVPDIEECVGELEGEFSTYPPACFEAIVGFYECVYMPECSVILDEDMIVAHVETNCADEGAAVETLCPED